VAATIAEDLNESRRSESDSSGKRATRQYKIFGTSDSDEAFTLLMATAPATHTVLGTAVPIARSSVTPVDDTVDDSSGRGQWVGVVQYGFPGGGFGAPPPSDTSFFNFEAQTSSERVFRSIKSKSRHGAADDGLDPEGATDYAGLINVTDEGVEGVEILAPKFSFSMTAYIDDEDLQSAIADIARSVARTNDASFQGFAAGEVLFISASGARRADEESWEINFGFMCEPNRENIEVDTPLAPAGKITVAQKLGWDYIWARSVPYTDPDTGRLGTATEAVYVEQMYETADFSLLPIP
jgi:hypothetical protein